MSHSWRNRPASSTVAAHREARSCMTKLASTDRSDFRTGADYSPRRARHARAVGPRRRRRVGEDDVPPRPAAAQAAAEPVSDAVGIVEALKIAPSTTCRRAPRRARTEHGSRRTAAPPSRCAAASIAARGRRKASGPASPAAQNSGRRHPLVHLRAGTTPHSTFRSSASTERRLLAARTNRISAGSADQLPPDAGACAGWQRARSGPFGGRLAPAARPRLRSVPGVVGGGVRRPSRRRRTRPLSPSLITSDPVADVVDDAEVVGDEQVGDAELAPAGRRAGRGPGPGSRRRARRPARRRRSPPARGASARAIATRWRWPPESCSGRRVEVLVAAGRPVRAARRHALARPSGRGSPSSASASSDDPLDGPARVEGAERVLVDDRDAPPALAPLALGQVVHGSPRRMHRCRRRARAAPGRSAPSSSCPSPTRRRSPASRPRRSSKETSSTTVRSTAVGAAEALDQVRRACSTGASARLVRAARCRRCGALDRESRVPSVCSARDRRRAAPACRGAAGRPAPRRGGPCSTISPPRITATRSASRATTARSWLIRISDVPRAFSRRAGPGSAPAR